MLQFIAGQPGTSKVCRPSCRFSQFLQAPEFWLEAPVYISWLSQLFRLDRILDFLRTIPRRLKLNCVVLTRLTTFICLLVMLKVGLAGKSAMFPPQPVEEDPYHFDDSKLNLLNIEPAGSLWEALKEMEQDSNSEALGEHTFNKYLEAKFAE